MQKELTLDLCATFFGEDDGVFTRFLLKRSHIGYIALNRSQFRRPAREIVGIVDIRRTRRRCSEELSHRAVRNLILIHQFAVTVDSLNDITVIVFPRNGVFLFHPLMPVRIHTGVIPVVIGVIIRVDTMIEVVFLLYFPPLALALHQDKESSCTSLVAVGMVVVAHHLGAIPGCINRHVLSRFCIIGSLATNNLLHETFVFRQLHGCPTAITIAV